MYVIVYDRPQPHLNGITERLFYDGQPGGPHGPWTPHIEGSIEMDLQTALIVQWVFSDGMDYPNVHLMTPVQVADEISTLHGF